MQPQSGGLGVRLRSVNLGDRIQFLTRATPVSVYVQTAFLAVEIQRGIRFGSLKAFTLWLGQITSVPRIQENGPWMGKLWGAGSDAAAGPSPGKFPLAITLLMIPPEPPPRGTLSADQIRSQRLDWVKVFAVNSPQVGGTQTLEEDAHCSQYV